METLHEWLGYLVDGAILLFEFIGVIVVVIAGLRGIVEYGTHSPDSRVHVAKGMAMGLEFMLGSEILRTVVVREFNEIFIVAGIIALRAVLTLLIHWEIKNESGGTAGEPSEKSKK